MKHYFVALIVLLSCAFMRNVECAGNDIKDMMASFRCIRCILGCWFGFVMGDLRPPVQTRFGKWCTEPGHLTISGLMPFVVGAAGFSKSESRENKVFFAGVALTPPLLSLVTYCLNKK